MAAITSAATGNWSATGTWTGGVVPGNGDTVIIQGTNVVTVDVDTTVGASNGVWVSGGNPAAIQLNATGRLIIAATKTLTLRGDFVFNNTQSSVGTGLTLNAGATLQFDASATSPNTTQYRFSLTNNAIYYCKLVCNGTQAQPCLIWSMSASAKAYFFNGNPWANFGSLSMTYTTFRNMGGSSNPFWVVSYSGSTVTVNVSNCTFDNCGRIAVGVVNPTAGQCTFTDCNWINSPSAVTANTELLSRSSYVRCVFDKLMGTSVNQDNLILTNCYLGFGITNGGQTTTTQQSMTKSFFRQTSQAAPQLTATLLQDILWMQDHNVNNPNMTLNGPKSQVYDGVIFEYTNNSGSGAGINVTNAPNTSGQTYEIKRVLCIPNATGINSCSIFSMDGAFTPNGSINVHNNTATTMGRHTSVNEAFDNTAGSVTNYSNNLSWTFPGYTASDPPWNDVGHTSSGPSPVDNCSPANIRTNNNFGNYISTYPSRTWYTNQANGYCGAFSSTPGVTDTHFDPMFKDVTRNTATFDTAYLHNVAGSTWASHAGTDTFNVGDIVSNNNPIYYGGALINFRCIASHTKSTAGTEPGGSFSSSWRTQWEFASFNSIRTNLTGGVNGAGTLYTDPAINVTSADVISTLLAWIRDGFQPQNGALRKAGYDGSDIGAVTLAASSNQGLMMMGCG